MQNSRRDVVVVGGGIVGFSIAYRLANEGMTVTVIERDSVGNNASGYALGLLNPTNETGVTEGLNHHSFKMHKELLEVVQEESGVDVQILKLPHIELALEQSEVIKLKSEVSRINEFDEFNANWLETEEVLRLEPRVSSDIFGGILVEHVIMVDSYNLTLATAQAAEHRGVEVVLGEVTGINYHKGTVAGVTLKHAEIACDSVVLALGPWSGAASSWIDINIPIVPQKGEIVRVEGLEPQLNLHLHGNAFGSSCSVVQKKDNAIWLAATVEDGTGFDVNPSIEAMEVLSRRGVRMVPALESHQMVLHTACMRPVSSDGEPILGKVPGKDRVFLATGTGGKGVLMGPVIGKAISDLVIQGQTDLPISNLGLERFGRSIS